MTIAAFLANATKTLKDANIDSARLDTLILLEDTLHTDRALLLAHPETEIDNVTEVDLNTKITQRAQHTPLAYIRGKADFYGRTFTITDDVLVPRPETEVMIELCKNLALPAQARIVDVGTGSGCIGVTIELELPGVAVELRDIDNAALAIAKNNSRRLGAINITAHQDDLLSSNVNSYDVVLANLPYVPDNYPINQAATHEPKLALFAGTDGLELYRRFWKQIAKLPYQPSYILTESLLEQHSAVASLADDAGYQRTKTQGLIQAFTKA